MEVYLTNYFKKWPIILPIIIAALLFSHLELVDTGFALPDNYVFPFTAFIVNAFYIVCGLFIFQLFSQVFDRTYPWTNGVPTRFTLQLLVTLVLYLLFQYLIVFGLEPTFNQNHSTPSRILLTFGIGIILVIFMNLFSLLLYFQHKAAQTYQPTDFIQGTQKGKKLALPKADFYYFYIQSGVVFGLTKDFQKIILKESLADLEKILVDKSFFRANRKEIISKKAIGKIAYNSSESAEVELINNEGTVLISRRRVAAFRKWVN